MTPRILLRHLRGSKAHRVDQFPLPGLDALTLGRATASDVQFDDPLDDTISRRHAVIRVSHSDPLSFRIVDLDSGNGVRVNGRPVLAEQELRAHDLVELGPGGPAFRLDVEPGPGPARGAGDETVRIPLAAAAAGERGDTSRLPQVRPRAAPGRPARAALALATAVALAAGAVAILGRGAGKDAQVRADAGDRAAADREPAGPPAPVLPAAAAQAPAAPPPRAAVPSAAVVAIEARWRLYDKGTGQPVFQKVLLRHGQRFACLVETADGTVVPWLTTADEDHMNSPVGGVIEGSGVIVDSDGSIITDRHIAAGWTARHLAAGTPDRQVALFRAGTGGSAARIVSPADLRGGSGPAAWIPGDGGTLFAARRPVAIGAGAHNLEGRNDRLDVLLPRSHARTPARLVLLSATADVAELRIDVGRPLPALALARDPVAAAGTPVTIFGYLGAPADSLDEQRRTGDLPRFVSLSATMDPAPAPVADPPPGAREELARVSAGAADLPDGAPVLGADGAVLGILTPGPDGQGGPMRVSAAAQARALLESR